MLQIGDDDPRLSVSGCQKMEGEDLGFDERQKAQRAQQREWALAQMKEKENRKRLEDAQNRFLIFYYFIFTKHVYTPLIDWNNCTRNR